MKGKTGFTLIELMIVIAIIAIIAAIAIPNLLRSRMTANENNAAAFCKQLTSYQAVWWRSDYDRNALKDYWMFDVAGMANEKPAAGNAYQLIDVQTAKADSGSFGGATVAVIWGFTVTPAQGYTFQAFTLNDENGNAYYQNYLSVGGGALGAAIAPQGPPLQYSQKQGLNNTNYAFQALPYTYNSTGINTFIVNQQGAVYRRDTGGNAAIASWPAADPTTLGWGRAD